MTLRKKALNDPQIDGLEDAKVEAVEDAWNAEILRRMEHLDSAASSQSLTTNFCGDSVSLFRPLDPHPIKRSVNKEERNQKERRSQNMRQISAGLSRQLHRQLDSQQSK
jgi:hypothetical protein